MPASESRLIQEMSMYELNKQSKMDQDNQIQNAAILSGEEIIQNLQVGFIVQGPDSEILLCNDRALALLGVEKNQLLGKTSFDPQWRVIHEDGSPFPGEHHPVPQAIKTKLPVRNVVMGVFHPQKRDFQWILVDAEPYLYPEGTIKHVVCTFVDISTKKQFEQKSIKKTEFINHLSKVSFDAIWDWDIILHTVQFSDSYQQLFGTMGSGMDIESAILQKVHPKELPALLNSVTEALRSKAVDWIYEHRYLNSSNEYAHVLNRAQIIRDANGNAIRVIGAMQDISLLKKERHRLELLESVITNTNDAVIITEAEPFEEPGPRILYVNDALCRITGYTADELIGKTPRIFQGPKTNREELKKLGQSLRNWESCEATVINYKKNGEPFWLHMTISPVADEQGWYTHWIAIERDVTANKKRELNNQMLAELREMFAANIELGQLMQQIMEKLMLHFELGLAEYWLMGMEDNRLHLMGSASRDSKNGITATNYNDSYSKEAQLLASSVLASSKIAVWKKGDETLGFLQWEYAAYGNFEAAYAIPLLQDNKITAVFIVAFNTCSFFYEKDASLVEVLLDNLALLVKQKQLTRQLDQLFKYAPDIICIVGTDGFFKKVNPVALKILEYSEDELLSFPITTFLFPGKDGKTSSEKIDFNTGKPNYSFENRVVTQSGKTIWLSWTFTPSPEAGLLYGVAKDVTEKKEYEQLLNKANDLALIGGWEIDMINNKAFWSNITLKICEIDPLEKPDMNSWLEFFKEGTDRDIIKQKVKETIQLRMPWDEELRIVTTSGKEKWVRSIGDAEFVDDKCIRVFGSFQDIDTRKQTELVLQKNLKELKDFKFALDQSAIVSTTNAKGVILNINENFSQISKYSREELIGQNHNIVNSGFHSKVFFDQLWSTILSGSVWKGEIKNKAKDGSFYWVYTTIIPFLDSKGNIQQFLSIRFDITEEKDAEEALKISKDRYDLVGKATNDAIFDLDIIQNKIEWVGEGLGSIMGFESFIDKKPTNTHLKDFVHPDDLPRVMEKQLTVLLNPNEYLWNDEFRFKNSEGGFLQVHARGIIIKDENGKGLRVIGSIQDITKLRENENRLQELNKDLEVQTKALAVSNEELEQFAYVASHDLQEPLRMVTSFMAQLEKKYGDVIDEKGKRYIEYAVDGAKRMRQIILDLLDYSRVGKMDDQKEDVDLNELLKGIQILFRKQMEDKKAMLRITPMPVVHSFVAPLQQVFQNLIGNALKFTKPNVPAMIRIGSEDLGEYWKFSISDNGIGMEIEDLEKIFIIFKQLNSKEEFPGSGIGLAVTKKIIEKQGGKIWVESQMGHGSTFYFTLPK
jgi:PAS domain S-box-containing protein